MNNPGCPNGGGRRREPRKKGRSGKPAEQTRRSRHEKDREEFCGVQKIAEGTLIQRMSGEKERKATLQLLPRGRKVWTWGKKVIIEEKNTRHSERVATVSAEKEGVKRLRMAIAKGLSHFEGEKVKLRAGVKKVQTRKKYHRGSVSGGSPGGPRDRGPTC